MTDLQTPENTLLTVADVSARYRVSRPTLDRWRRLQMMPQPMMINTRPRWRLSDLEAWEAEQGGQG